MCNVTEDLNFQFTEEAITSSCTAVGQSPWSINSKTSNYIFHLETMGLMLISLLCANIPTFMTNTTT